MVACGIVGGRGGGHADRDGVLREATGDRFGNLEINAFGTFTITSRRRAQTEDLIIQRG